MIAYIMKDTVSRIALKDIAKHIREMIGKESYNDENNDVWIVGIQHLRSKEVTRMNKELGILGINKTGNENGKDYIIKKFGKWKGKTIDKK